MSLVHVGSGLAALLGLGIIVVGVWYLVAPQAIANGFGLPAEPMVTKSTRKQRSEGCVSRSAFGPTSNGPQERAAAWLGVKGVRDIVSGLVVLVLFALGEFHALGWIALVAAVTPAGDAAIVLRNDGKKGLAYGMHGGTALAAVVAGCLLLLG